jgi:hypothetical protein
MTKTEYDAGRMMLLCRRKSIKAGGITATIAQSETIWIGQVARRLL